MAEETLTLRMTTRGASRTVGQIKAVAEAVDEVDDNTARLDTSNRKAAKSTSALGSAMRQVIARMIVMGAIIGVLAVGLGGLAGAIGAVAIAFGATLLPIAGIAIAAVVGWKKEVENVGSAAWQLNKVFKSVKRTFMDTFSPAAHVVMRALARGLRSLQPMLKSLAGPMRIFAKALGAAVELFMRGLGEMGPDLQRMVLALAPLMRMLVGPALALTRAFVKIATAVAKWMASAKGQNAMRDIWAGIAAVAAGLWEVLKGIWEIAKLVWKDLMPEGGKGFIGMLEGIAKALQWVADNWKTLGPIVYVVGAILITFLLLAAAAGGAFVASIAAGASMVILIVSLLVGLAVALYMAYQRVTFMRKAMDWLWGAMKRVAMWIYHAGIDVWHALVDAWQWVSNAARNTADAITGAWGWVKRAATNTVNWVKTAWRDFITFMESIPGKITTAASGMWSGVKSGFRSAINWVIDQWNGLVEGLSGSFLGKVAGKVGVDVGAATLNHIATGGPIRKGGAALVGERGPEVVSLPTGSRVWSNQQSASAIEGGGGDTLIAATFVTPDGEVLARQTVRAARKKQSTR